MAILYRLNQSYQGMRIHLTLFILLCAIGLRAQGTFTDIIDLRQQANGIQVLKANGDSLRFPWAGGMWNAMFSNIDVNGDGKQDLFVFDHADSTVQIYLAQGFGTYNFAPDYGAYFPQMKTWAFLRDYNRDGKPDIFAYSRSFGAAFEVYKNTSTSAGLSFKLITDELLTHASVRQNYTTNIYTDGVNMPSIADMDGDSDLDILAMDPSGLVATYYKSRDADRNGSTNLGGYDSLWYEPVDDNWGMFIGIGGISTLPDSFVHAPQIGLLGGNHYCKNKHAGGNLLTLDKDGDGDHDLLYSDINGAGFSMVENGRIGSGKCYDTLVKIDTGYIRSKVPFYPGASHVDVDGDGKRDLLLTPMALNVSASRKSVYYYHNVGTDKKPDFRYAANDFLQSEMIDEGRSAVPAFYDADGDKRPEFMVVATAGEYSDNNYAYDKLVLYRNLNPKGKAKFIREQSDYLGLSSLKISGMAPVFADMNADGRPDLVLGAADGKLRYFEASAVSGRRDTFQSKISPSLDTIDVGNFSYPAIGDVDGDGRQDLIIGSSSATLVYYRNFRYDSTGAAGKYPAFAHVTDTLGLVLARDTAAGYPGATLPTIGDLDHDGHQDLMLGTRSGELFVYRNIASFKGSPWKAEAHIIRNQLINLQYMTGSHYGSYSAPALACLNGDSIEDVVVGNTKGGLNYFANYTSKAVAIAEQRPEDQLNEIKIYPNPSQGQFNLILPADRNSYSISVYNTQGQIISLVENNFRSGLHQINLLNASSGMYLIRISTGGLVRTERLIVR